MPAKRDKRVPQGPDNRQSSKPRRPKLTHPSRAILVHIPTADLDQLDAEAQTAKTSRSELIRQRILTSQAKT
jgi:hypothetical protein